MLREARARIRDADLLSADLGRDSDSDALLRILGFEILLKCALVVTGTLPAHTHNYAKLWSTLPEASRAKIVADASARMPGVAELEDLDQLLKDYQFVFERARYSYEMYEGYSDQDRHDLGELWVALGATMKEAIVAYHPLELECLNYALERFIEAAP